MEQQSDANATAAAAGLAPVLESRVFSVRRNDPNMNHLYIGSGLDPRAWKQLGSWLQKNTHMRYLCLQSCHLKGQSMHDFCTGLKHNESIREFEIGGNKLKKEEIQSLAPFISNNPNLHTLNIEGSLDCGVELLSSAIMSRTHSIENISLDDNAMGCGDKKQHFDTFITALIKNKNLRRLSLMGNGIGVDECTSLARLLKSSDSKLNSLVLRHNHIDNECAGILAEALENNDQLHNIDLDRNGRVSAKGLMHFLRLICGTPSKAITIVVHWKCPDTNDMKSAALKMKVDEPLHTAKPLLAANKNFSLTSDMTNLQLKLDWERLDWSETPFFYGLKDGTIVDAVAESWGCNTDNYESRMHNIGRGIYGSLKANHVLSSLGYETARRRNFHQGKVLREFLESNKEENKLHPQRTKVFRCHIEQYFTLKDILEIDALLQPYVLSWIGLALNKAINPPTPEVRLNATYQILRGMPMLCGF